LIVRADGGDRITTVFAAAQNVCFWHKADITIVQNNVRFGGGKADMALMWFDVRL